MLIRTRTQLISAALCAVITSAFGQDAPPPVDRIIKYSPYPGQDFPNKVFYGDVHLHTS